MWFVDSDRHSIVNAVCWSIDGARCVSCGRAAGADSQFRHALEADMEPFKGLLLGLFFIAVGMSVNFGLLTTEFGTVIALVFGLVALKAVVL